MEVAGRMKEEMEIDSKVEVFMDDMDDAFNKEFAAWPIRYFIAKEGRLLYKSENSIKDSRFDQVSLLKKTKKVLEQNAMHKINELLLYQQHQPEFDRDELRMLHFSSTGNSSIFQDYHRTYSPASELISEGRSRPRRTCNCLIL